MSPWRLAIQRCGHVCSLKEEKSKPRRINRTQHPHANRYEGLEGYETEYSSAYGTDYSTPFFTQNFQQQRQQQQQQQYRFQNLEQYMSQCEAKCEMLRQQQQFNYNPKMQQECQWSQRLGDQREHDQHIRKRQQTQDFQLSERTPAPLCDKHLRGAHYQPGHKLGVQVPDEMSRIRQTINGPVQISCEDDMANCYTPLYKYKDWVERSEMEVWRDCNTDSLICRMPEMPTQHWDFYNEVRMNRPAKELYKSTYGICRVIPIPRNKDLENLQEYESYGGQFSAEQDRGLQGKAFQMANLCRC